MKSDLTADTLLHIPVSRPERLFTGDARQDTILIRSLQARWHPDKHPDNPLVFAHIQALFERRKAMLAAGTWPGAGVAEFKRKDGRLIRYHYLRRASMEFGHLYIGATSIAYELRHADSRWQPGMRLAADLTYASPKMKTEMARFLPEIEQEFETADASVFIIAKPSDLIRLRDVMAHLDGPLDVKHVMWIMSALLNIACYLQYAHLTHNAIDMDACFISPQYHSVVLLGGWWFAAREGEPLRFLPSRSILLASSKLRRNKVATRTLDLDLIRLLGRELLGDASGVKLLRNATVPAAVAQWLTMPSAGNAVTDYQGWAKVRDGCFGGRRFTPLDVSPSDVYNVLS